jgi:ATP-dependent Clp protease ATP-binding subunit ClpA
MNYFLSDDFDADIDEALAKHAEKQGQNRLRAEDIFEVLKQKVIGQDPVCERLATSIARRAAQKRPNKPLVTALFSGPTGVGKTEMAKAVSKAVYGETAPIIIVPCNTMGKDPAGLEPYFGYSSGYVNAHRGEVCEFAEKHKKTGGVIVFDEYEKAAPDKKSPLGEYLLYALDNGVLTSKYDGSSYDITKFVVILTSNAAQEQLLKATEQFADQIELEKESKRILKDTLAPEFLGRMKIVSTFRPLAIKDRARVAGMGMNSLASSYELELVGLDRGAMDLLVMAAEKAGNVSMRDVNNWIEDIVSDAFAEAKYDLGFNRVIGNFDKETGEFTVRDADAEEPSDAGDEDQEEGEAA